MQPELSIGAKDEKYRQTLADAVEHAVNLLKEDGVISRTVSNAISPVSKEIGHEICRRVKDIASDIELVEDEEVMHHMDSDLEDDFEEVPEPTEPEISEEKGASFSGSSDEEENAEEPKGERIKSPKRVSWETKMRVVRMAKLHPGWSFKTIRSKTTRFLKSDNQLWEWMQEVEGKGSSFNKYDLINDWTYKRFMGARSRKRQVTTRMLQQWATERAQDFVSDGFQFNASQAWVDKFKRDRKIRHRRIIRFVNKADPPMLEVMLP